MIRINEVSYCYPRSERKALDKLSFTLQDNEICVLLGPNGAGKTTLISLLTSSRKIQEGNIEIDGQSLSDMHFTTKNKLIGYVPQSVEFGDLSVYQTVLLGRLPYFHFSPCKGDKEAAMEVIERLSLTPFIDRNVNELSGGEKQLVAIAVALVKKPRILILDEPTSNLDLANEISLLRIVKKAAKEDNATVLLSMHDLNQALLVGEHFLLLKEGKLMGDCRLEEMKGDLLSSIYGVDLQIIDNNGRLSTSLKENI